MYPRISDLFRDFLGFELPFPIYAFGFMVALAILVATWLTRIELDRKYALGLAKPVDIKIKDKKGRERTVKASPSEHIWTMMALAALFGVLGSKLFHIIDNFDQFVLNPGAFIFSGSGLTIYGGLIMAGGAILYFARKKGIDWGILTDATAPGLMLAYGIGRIGCYLAGDGDWGVCSTLENKPGWLPDWLWTETFPNNVAAGTDNPPINPVEFNERSREVECAIEGAVGVYPTMLYEFAMAAVLAGGLWLLRKHPFKAGWLFGVYLVLNGVERFLIETIRVNPETSIGLPQAQIIAVGFMIAGVVLIARTMKRQRPGGFRDPASEPSPEPAAA